MAIPVLFISSSEAGNNDAHSLRPLRGKYRAAALAEQIGHSIPCQRHQLLTFLDTSFAVANLDLNLNIIVSSNIDQGVYASGDSVSPL